MIGDRDFKSQQGLLILMADDDEDDCLLAGEALEESNAPGTLACVEDGIKLLEYLARCRNPPQEAGTPLPALILLDLNMPRKTGRQALAEIKSIPAFQDIPIVVLTTSREEKDIAFCRKMGVKDFITKPAAFGEWVEIMKSLAGNWLAHDAGKKQAP